jgi:hypothetical protein
VLGPDVLAKSQAVTIADEEVTSELTLQLTLAGPDHCEGSGACGKVAAVDRDEGGHQDEARPRQSDT